MKKIMNEAELEVIKIENTDVIATSFEPPVVKLNSIDWWNLSN